MTKISGFTLKQRIKWVKAYPILSGVKKDLPTEAEIDEGFKRLLNNKHMGHILSIQDCYEPTPQEKEK